MKHSWVYFSLWFPMMIIAITNGAARDLLYKQSALGELWAHQTSTVSLILLFAIYFRFVFNKWRLESSSQAIMVGLMWLAMTLAFEFVFGHFAAHKSWSELLQEYNLIAGRVWVFIPLWLVIGPYLYYRAIK